MPRSPGLRKSSFTFAGILPEQYTWEEWRRGTGETNTEYLKGRSFCKAGAIIHHVHIGFIQQLCG